MTSEEIQRTMDFILGQQAQIAASFQREAEERKRDGARIKRLEEAFQLVAQLAQATETRLERFETSSTNLEVRTSNLDARMEELAAAQAHADERLSALSTSSVKIATESQTNYSFPFRLSLTQALLDARIRSPVGDYAQIAGIQMPRKQKRGKIEFQINPEYDERIFTRPLSFRDGPKAWQRR